MTGRPTILVQLDDGSGSFPFNITNYVDLNEGYTITRGREDQFAQIQPSTLAMTLDNTTGRFTPGSSTYGIHAEQMIRVTETVGGTSSIRFTGYVTEWPVEWPNGMTKMSVARISAVDRLASLARRTFRSMIEEEFSRDDMLAYFPLGESGDVHAGTDVTGNNAPITPVESNPGDVEFGASKPDFGSNFLSRNELTQVSFHDGNGGYLRGSVAGVRGGDLRIEFLFSTYHLSNQQLIQLSFGSSILYIYTTAFATGSSAKLNVERISGGVSQSLITSSTVSAAADHHVMVTETGGVRTLYIDGVNRGSGADASPTGPFTSTLTVGLTASSAQTQMAHVVVGSYSSLAVSSLANHKAVTLNGFFADDAEVRIGRYADYAGVPATARSFEHCVQNLPYFPIVDRPALDAIEAVMAAERGTAFIQGDGKLRLQNRTARNNNVNVTPIVTVTSDQIDGDVSCVLDMQQVRNYVTVTRLNGVAQTVKDDASIATHGRYPDDYSDFPFLTDGEALTHAQTLVTKYAEPVARMPNVGLDALSLPSSVQQAILRLEISSRITITGLPSQAPFSTADLLVEGWTETVSAAEWRMVCNTSAASIEQ